jgi:hypothetical protein
MHAHFSGSQSGNDYPASQHSQRICQRQDARGMAMTIFSVDAPKRWFWLEN